MVTVSFPLNEETLQRAREAALKQNTTLEKMIAEMVETLVERPRLHSDVVMGMFSDDPDLIDQIVAGAYAARETNPFRQADGPTRH